MLFCWLSACWLLSDQESCRVKNVEDVLRLGNQRMTFALSSLYESYENATAAKEFFSPFLGDMT